MKDIDSKIEQCKKDLEAAQANLKRLEAEKKAQTKHKHGDIVVWKLHPDRPKRVVLFSEKLNKLVAFDKNGLMVGRTDINNDYLPTGENIFTDNLLDLGYW